MKRYVLTLLLTASAAACSTNKPAHDPSEVAAIEPTGTDSTLVTESSDDTSTAPSAANDDTEGSGQAPQASSTWGNSSSSTTPESDPPVSDPPVSDSATAPATATAPAGTAPPGTAPDNTKVNERDRNAGAVTPVDQGNNQTDLKITQQIRQAVMADDSLSFTAKNVKIIAVNGKVTLRGPVSSDQERAAIEAAAKKVAGPTNVENQIEVKK